MNEETRNMILAMVLSGLVMLVWFALFPPEPIPPAPQAETPRAAAPQGDINAPAVATQGEIAIAPSPGTSPTDTREAALAKTDRIVIDTPRLQGSLSLTGGRIDDLSLLDYNVRLNDPSQKVRLLSPAGGAEPFYAVYGWAPGQSLSFDDVPTGTTEWQIESGKVLTPNSPVTLVWDNGKGLIFRRDISIDQDYMFTVRQSVENTGASDVTLQPYGIVIRRGEPSDLEGFFISHEGAIATSDGTSEYYKYRRMRNFDPNPAEAALAERVDVQSSGWVGIADKYWMAIIVPNAGQNFTSVVKYTEQIDTYQTDARLPAMVVAAGSTAQVSTSLFAGAKEWSLLNRYQTELGIDRFIDSIDWGWFFFLTKPIFQVLHYFNQLIGNMGWAIICLTLVIKALLFPLAYRSYVSMARMKDLQPEMEKLKERVGDDRQKMQQEMMALYREKKVNPAAGCLPILMQIPIFFSLYKVIFVTIEMYHAPFMWWIKDLSAPDPTSWINLFGLLPFAAPGPESLFAIFSIGVFPILMGVTMWLQQKLNPAPTDPTQQMIFAWMPWVFMFMLGIFASGLIIYWVANNTITFIQQYAIMRSQGVKPDVFGNILAGFKRMRASKE